MSIEISQDRTLSRGTPSKPILGVLPLSRAIPQDVHSVMDYGNGVAAGAGVFMTDDPVARIASAVLGAGAIGVASVSDYRVSAAKLIPIETHEMIDHAWGVAAIAAPFVFGYWKRSPQVALMHVVAGATSILTALFTDYRSASRRSSR